MDISEIMYKYMKAEDLILNIGAGNSSLFLLNRSFRRTV
jgi:hypothetical protein